MGIGNRLKALRKERKLTLKQVGDAIGVTATSIHSYEKESRKPSHDMIQKLAQFYSTTSDAIIGTGNELNLNALLKSEKLHWDGVLLEEDELEFIKHFLEIRVTKKKAETDISKDA